MKTVLITGVGGFIGGNITRYLMEKGYRIYGVYHNTKPDLLEGMITIQADLADSVEFYERMENVEIGQIDAVLHFAAQMLGSKIEDYLENTINSTRNLLAYAVEHHIDTFIYASSIAVYGMTDIAVNEKSDRINLSDYGISKFICERLLEDAAIKNRISIRLPRMLGRKIDLSCPWIPKLTESLLKNQRIRYFNPGMEYNNLAHCDTLAEFIDTLIHRDGLGYVLVGIGSENPQSILSIIKYLKELTHSTSILVEKSSEQRNTCFLIDISKAVSMGYKPMTVRKTLECFVRDLENIQ